MVFVFILMCLSDTMCPSPVDIPNALVISDGYQNGSITLYSCLAGYIPNDGSQQITCNGTHWSSTMLTCSSKYLFFKIVLEHIFKQFNNFFFQQKGWNIVRYKLTFHKNSIVDAYGQYFKLFSLINLRSEFLSGRRKYDC